MSSKFYIKCYPFKLKDNFIQWMHVKEIHKYYRVYNLQIYVLQIVTTLAIIKHKHMFYKFGDNETKTYYTLHLKGKFQQNTQITTDLVIN